MTLDRAVSESHLPDEVVDRLCSGQGTARDAKALRAYLATVDARPDIWIRQVLETVAVNLSSLRQTAESAEAQGKINGGNLSTIRGLIEAGPAGVEAVLTAHEERVLAHLAPLHAASQRAIVAEAAATELEVEARRVEIDRARNAAAREHSGALEGRSLVRHVLERMPWAVVLGALALLASGASMAELARYLVPMPVVGP